MLSAVLPTNCAIAAWSIVPHLGWVAMATTGMAVAALAAWGWIVWRRRIAREWNSPRGLFLELCRAHKLSMTDRWLLRLMAETQRLEQPGLLFVEADRFRTAESCPRLDARTREIEQIRAKLFPPAEEPAAVAG
jgi:hypothetical protein